MDSVRVLIAEDDDSMRDSLAELISSDPGCELVGIASDAEEAIEAASREHPDVAVVDVRMPGGGGPRAAQEILRRSPDTNVIALSAHEDRASILAMLKAGAVAYVAKSATTGELREAIHRSVEGRASLAVPVARRDP